MFKCYIPFVYTLFYKQLASAVKDAYIQSFRGSKLLNSWLVVLPSNLCLWGMQFSEFKIDIYDQWF